MPNFLFYLAQICGAGGAIATIVSLQSRQKTRLLHIQIFSCILYIIQFLCLGAWSGCLIKFIALARDYLFSRFKRVPWYQITLVIAAILFATAFTYAGPLSLLPCLGTSILTIGLACKNLTALRILDIIACAVYVIYSIAVEAYAGAFAISLELASSFIAILRFHHERTHKQSRNQNRNQNHKRARKRNLKQTRKRRP